MIKVEQVNPACITVKLDEIQQGWEQWVMLSSDRHFDSVKCDRKLMREHLDKAKERNALIIDAGDFFDVMQGRYDPRRSYDEMRPEYKKNAFLDAIVLDAAEFLKPYAENFLVIGRGNHDQAVVKNNGVDIISNLVHQLNTQNDTQVKVGGYGGWVRFLFGFGKSESRNLKYFHGAGGDSPVTLGTINNARQAVYLPDADFVHSGHNHNAYITQVSRERLSDRGVVSQDKIHFIRTPSYAFDYGDGTQNWHVERGGQPKPRGCAWIRFYYENRRIKEQVFLDTE